MKVCALAVVCVVSVVFAAPVRAETQVELGMKVFTAQKCALCHSVAGKGNAKGPLDAVGDKLKPEEIRAWIVTPAKMSLAAKAERKPAMKAYASLSKGDLDALVAFMASLKAK